MSCWEGKRYKLESSDNYDEYLRAMGVGMITRRMANSLNPVVELRNNYDGSYTLTSSVPSKTTTINFRPGEEFDEQAPDGSPIRGICNLNGDTLIHEQRTVTPSTIINEFSDNQLVSTLTCGGVRCVRVYRAV